MAVAAASVAEIERLNILQASLLAMRRAVLRLPRPVDAVLVDGNRAPALPCVAQCVVGGDGICLSIAAASIIAKVTRDRLMTRLAARFPAYAWERNAGYGTATHRAALVAYGATHHHRRQFGAVRVLLAGA
jgi:ribonuclease HII